LMICCRQSAVSLRYCHPNLSFPMTQALFLCEYLDWIGAVGTVDTWCTCPPKLEKWSTTIDPLLFRAALLPRRRNAHRESRDHSDLRTFQDSRNKTI
jgi:hypothetical protein